MHPIVPLMMFMSVLIPARGWTPISQPVTVEVQSAGDVTLILSDLNGKAIDPPGGPGSADVEPGATVDLHKMFLPVFSQSATYLVWAVPKGKTIAEFQGTPLVMEIRRNVGVDTLPGPTVIRMEPLVYVQMQTDQGAMAIGFFFDGAPNTVDQFLSLVSKGFYDGLTFHRIVPGFIMQGGDPRGDGTGGPGFSINAEFNDHLHLPGAISMARETDPLEANGAAPRPDYANSAGSQFFISLNHDNTRVLDHHYTVFGTVLRGMPTVEQIARQPLGGPMKNVPKTPIVIKSMVIKPVTPLDDPYAALLHLPQTPEPSTMPATEGSGDAASATTEAATPATEPETQPAMMPDTQPTTEPASAPDGTPSPGARPTSLPSM